MFTMQEKRLSFAFKLAGGIFAVLFFVLFTRATSAAAINAPTAPTSTSNVLYNSIQYNWSWGGGDETRYIVERSTNGVNYTVVSTTLPTTTLSYTFTNLSINTQYWFRVAAATSSSPTSTYVTSSPVYTDALVQLGATLSNPTTSSIAIPVILNNNLNPASTTFAIRNVITNTYLDAAGQSTTTIVRQTTSTWGSSLVASGLQLNTGYYFGTYAFSGDGASTGGVNSSVKYTLANPAGTPTIGSPTASTLRITLDVNGNPANTEFAILNVTTNNYLDSSGAASVSPVWQTNASWGSSFAATGLSANTGYQFSVIARNGDAVAAATSSPSALTYTASSGSSAIPVSSASQGGVPFNPTPVTSPAPIAVPPISSIPTGPINPVVMPRLFVSTLMVGSKGNEVAALQQKLREQGFFKFASNTGYYGAVTKAAVVAFQKKYNLKPYPGVVGPLTRAKLNSL